MTTTRPIKYLRCSLKSRIYDTALASIPAILIILPTEIWLHIIKYLARKPSASRRDQRGHTKSQYHTCHDDISSVFSHTHCISQYFNFHIILQDVFPLTKVMHKRRNFRCKPGGCLGCYNNLCMHHDCYPAIEICKSTEVHYLHMFNCIISVIRSVSLKLNV